MNNSRITRQNVVRDGNRYCGPLVIAALLGCTTAEAAAKVREATDSDRAIKGMFNHEMLKTLARNGFTVAQREVPKLYLARRRPGQSAEDAVRYSYEQNGPDAPYTPLKLTGCTLAAWLRQRPDRAGTYVINVTGHYVLVVGRKFVDTGTRGEWVSIAKAPHRRMRVENVWQVSK